MLLDEQCLIKNSSPGDVIAREMRLRRVSVLFLSSVGDEGYGDIERFAEIESKHVPVLLNISNVR